MTIPKDSTVRGRGEKTCLLALLVVLCITGGTSTGTAEEASKIGGSETGATEEAPYRPSVPEDLLDDEHVREEFGINDFTTPSISKLFEMLGGLGKLPYSDVKREIPRSTPRDRVHLALQMGALIADGFLVVTSERVADLEAVGKAVIKHAKVLGAGSRVTRHSKSLLENSSIGNWDVLKKELAATQADVEAEMLLLRDVDVAHLIALGGWVRAFEIATVAAGKPYVAEKTQVLLRPDIAEYFLFSLEGLEPSVAQGAQVSTIRNELAALRDLVDVPEGKTLTEEELVRLQEQARALASAAGGSSSKTARVKG